MRDFDPNYQEVPALAKVGQKIVIFNPENKILFLRRSQKVTRPGGWDFPGGGLDLGEKPLDGILREVAEETLLHVTEIKPIHVQSVINSHDQFVVIIGYKGKTTESTPDLSWEHDDFKWLTAEEALQLELPEVHRSFLEKALEREHDSYLHRQTGVHLH